MEAREMDQGVEIAVLHVDDEPDLAATVAQFLEREDERFVIDTATRIDDGLEKLSEHEYDCVISDYDMPEQNGIEFLESVREMDAEVPFILYTGKGSEEVASEAMSAGVTDYLQKERGTSQYTVLANRVANAVATYRNRERAESMQRIRKILQEINKRLVRARSRDEIESAVCRVFNEAESYRLAWIVDRECPAAPVRPRTSAGDARAYLTTVSPIDRASAEPSVRALESQDLVTIQSLSQGSAANEWRETAKTYGLEGAAAIQLVYAETTYGVLCVYTDRPEFFDERERDLLREVADDVAHAMYRVESEQQLTEQRANLRLYERAVESSSDLLAGIDTEYTLIFANERYRDFHGIDREDIGEISLPDVLGDTWDAEVKQKEDLVLEGEVLRYELQRNGPNGEEYTFSVQDYPLRDEDGTILGVVGSMRDITERKAQEHQLRNLKERLDLAVEAASIGVWDWNVQTDDVRFNEQWAEMLGYELADIEPHLDAWKDRVHPDDIEATQQALSAHLAGETAYYECEHRMQTADGSWKWLRDIGQVTQRNEAGEAVRAVGIHLDIDERKQRERALEEREQRYRSLFELNPAVVWEQDISAVMAAFESLREQVDDVEAYLMEHPAEVHELIDKIEIVDISNEAVQRYGAPSKDYLKENLQEIFTPDVYEANVKVWQRLANGETHFRVPTVAKSLDGEHLKEIIEVRVPDAYANEYSHVYLSGIDITEREQREQKLLALHEAARNLSTAETVESICERTIEGSQEVLEFDRSTIDIDRDGCLSRQSRTEDIQVETTQMGIDEGVAAKTVRPGESIVIDDVKAHETAAHQNHSRAVLSIPIGEHGVFQAAADHVGFFEESDRELAELLISHTERALDRLDGERQYEQLTEFAKIVSHDLRNPLEVAKS